GAPPPRCDREMMGHVAVPLAHATAPAARKSTAAQAAGGAQSFIAFFRAPLPPPPGDRRKDLYHAPRTSCGRVTTRAARIGDWETSGRQPLFGRLSPSAHKCDTTVVLRCAREIARGELAKAELAMATPGHHP